MINQVFEKELRHIENNEIVEFVMLVFNNVPADFWIKPASSTGKYHPRSSDGRGGLVRHTKQVFHIAVTILDSRMIKDAERDVILAACLLHDAWKYDGTSRWTVKYHGRLAVKEIEKIVLDSGIFKESGYNMFPDWYYQVRDCVLAHNGRFTNEWMGEFSINQQIVHIADYLASRKFLEYAE